MGRLERLSDLYLVDAWKGGDPELKQSAAKELVRRYEPGLKRYVSKALPWDWTEDVVQEIWGGFFKYAEGQDLGKVPNLIRRIARNKRADAVKRLKIERSIESDEPLEECLTHPRQEEARRSLLEEVFMGKDLKENVGRIPYTPGLLSDCQRALWLLRYGLGFPVEAVIRIMGKKPQTIYSALSAARDSVRDLYSATDGFNVSPLNPEERWKLPREVEGVASSVWVVDLFEKPITPKLEASELMTLGLSLEEFQSKFVAIPLFQWGYLDSEITPVQACELLLMVKTQWNVMQFIIWLYLTGRRKDISNFSTPSGYRIQVIPTDRSLLLAYRGHIEFHGMVTPTISNPIYPVLQLHSPRICLPAWPILWNPGIDNGITTSPAERFRDYLKRACDPNFQEVFPNEGNSVILPRHIGR